MKANANASPSTTNKSAPPLRSTTVLRPPATGRAAPGESNAGFDSIKLNTYHDSSDLKAALRELEAAFAGSPSAPEASSPASTSSSYFPRGRTSGSSTASAQKPNAASTRQSQAPVPVQPRVPAARASPSPPPLPSRFRKRSSSSFMQLPPQLILRCFAFCDLRTLGVLCCVSVRLNVMVEQQGNALWAAAAQRHRIPVANVAAPREDLRRAMEQRANARNAEEAFYEAEIARMEGRLRARADEVYAQNVDVNRTIATGGESGGLSAAALPSATASPRPYWLHQHTRAEGGAGGDAAGLSADERNTTSSQLCVRLRSEIEALEEAKRLCECRVALQEDSLHQQEAQLLQWQALLFPTAASAPASGPAVADSSGKGPATMPLITALQLEQFERRIARLVLNGAITTATTTNTSAEGGKEEEGIPVVLRRGVEDFAAVELVLRVLGVHASGEQAKPSAEAPHSGTGQSTTTALKGEGGCTSRGPSAAARDAGKRWRAFQQVCPLNEDYGHVRCYLKAQEPRGVLPAAVTSDGGGRPSTKQTPALLRVSAFVRRVGVMTDSQVVQAWM